MDIITNGENTFTTEDFLISDSEKDKKKQRKRNLVRQYKFSDKKHSRGGIVSSLFALASLAALVVAVVFATNAAGEAGTIVGMLGAGAFVFSFIGIIIGLLSFRRTDVFYRYAWIGLISNAVIWLFITCIVVIFS